MRIQFGLAAAVFALPLSACATAPPSGYSNAAVSAYGAGPYAAATPPRDDDGLLPEPPADAKAGQCFAKVVAPGHPVYGPPAGPHLKWVQSPPQPGTIGPVWCQVWEAGYQPTVSFTPERYGWIRVICDKDATREKIGHIQHRLHDWGYYQGGYDGQYDQGTAEAVRRFQAERHIEHGGYLSYRTMEALEAAPPLPPVAPPVTYAQGYAGAYAAYGYPPAAYAPCGPQPCAPPPCGPAPCQGGYGYPQPAYDPTVGGRTYSVQRSLNRSGKTGF